MTAWVQWILDSNSIFKHFCIYKKIKFRIKCLQDPSTSSCSIVIVVTMDILFCWNPNFYVDHPTAISGHQFCKMCFILGLIAKCHTKAQNELQSRRQLWRWCPVTAGRSGSSWDHLHHLHHLHHRHHRHLLCGVQGCSFISPPGVTCH